MIFTVKDLEKYVDHRGRISIKGFSVRSINELQNAWDKACEPKAAVPSNKPRRLVRILSQEEKNTISELESLFESTYLGGCSTSSDSSMVSIDSIKSEEIEDPTKQTQVVEDDIEISSSEDTLIVEDEIEDEPSENKLRVNTCHWISNYKKYLAFMVDNRRRPSLNAVGEELKLAQWFDAIISLEDSLADDQANLVRTMREGAASFFSGDSFAY